MPAQTLPTQLSINILATIINMSTSHKVLTIILDGWGVNKPYPGNAITLANTPFYDQLLEKYPHITLECSGLAVGLPEGQMGTSEVNHMTIGAGRVIYQDLVKINKAIEENSFASNPEFQAAFEHVKKHNSKLHIKGLYSPGGVHSHSNHLKELIKAAKKAGLAENTYLHLITDGRDTKPQSALEYIKDLEVFLQKESAGQVASVSGRYFAMDRDHNWDRTDKYFEMITQGKTPHRYSSISEAIESNYSQETSDEFIEPTLITNSEAPVLVEDNDAVIFFNFRSDRPRQIVERFLEKGSKNLYYVTMTQYNPNYEVHVAFPPTSTQDTLGEVLASNKLKQLRITETEKFAHLTFFMNCKKEEPFAGEERVMLESNSDIKEHDEKPEMRAPDIAEKLSQQLATEEYEAVFVNFCNADMVGHTGNIPATIKGIEAIDDALKMLLPIAKEHGYDVIITADHGNAEQMLDEDGGDRLTAHTTYPVPFILVSDRYDQLAANNGSMADVAPTILKLLEIEQPKLMTGKSLI